MAAVNDNPVCLVRLLESGANIEAADTNGERQLHWAFRKGSSPSLKILLEHGANPFVKSKRSIISLEKKWSNMSVSPKVTPAVKAKMVGLLTEAEKARKQSGKK